MPAAITDPSFASFVARSPLRIQGDTGAWNWLNDLYNCGLAAPTLASSAPNTIVHGAPDTLVTLTGTGFVNSAAASAGATTLASNFVSATSLTATIPAASLASAGTLQLKVTNPDNRATGNVAFTVT